MNRPGARAGCERGFTLVETLVAAAIVVLVALSALAACKSIAGVTARTFRAGHDTAALDAAADALRDDAAGAFAVSAGTTGSEVDFYSKTATGPERIWGYVYDPVRHTLQRFDRDAGAAPGVRDVATGTVDSHASYPPLRDVTAFAARTLPADALADSTRNPYAGIGALLEHAPQNRTVVLNAGSAGNPPAAGGNAIVQVTLATAAAARTVHLLPGTLPAGFTVTGLPRWHAVVYRVDQTHRFLFGFAGKSHVFIDARVDVTYDGWRSRKAWCTFNLLGLPNGLDPHDPHADYKPDEPFEQAEALLADCRRLHPVPPLRDEPSNPPEPGVVTEPLPGPTPPACWRDPGPGGRCWPADAPVDWYPPGPLPADTPPPAWCAAHAESKACGTPPAAS